MKTQKISISRGSDPEFVVTEIGGRAKSAIEILKQDKFNPLRLDNGEKYYYDNVLLEMTIRPSFSTGDFIKNLRSNFESINKNLGGKYRIKPISSVVYEDSELQHPEAKRFGCDPEMCAYDVCVCNPPDSSVNFRSAGGHIHIGRKDYLDAKDDFLIDPFSKMRMIKLMDLFLGLPLCVLDNSKASKRRRVLYGKAGRHRPTEYGVEYRTPSNFWLVSPKLAEFVDLCVEICCEIERTREYEKFLNEEFENKIRLAIDNSDVDFAMNKIQANQYEKYKSTFTSLLKNNKNFVVDKFEKNWNI